MIDATARLEHYIDHLAPTWRALPEHRRGRFYVPEAMVEHAESLGIDPTPYLGSGDVPVRIGDPDPVLVAATQDIGRVRSSMRRIVYQGHGIGQSFVMPDGLRRKGYSGGPGFDGVSLFLATNERHAALWREAYPRADVEVVGSPKLGGRSREDGPRDPLVVASFHWAATLAGVPEAGSAWSYYRRALPGLARRFDFALHAHPRIRDVVEPEAERIGVPFIRSFDEVLDRAGVYVNDCSSTLWEFAAFGGRVVVLNSPDFRRDVHHGLRFWDCADVGPQVDRPSGLVAAILRAQADPEEDRLRRRAIAADLYPFDDPADRAARAILNLAGPPESAHPQAPALAGSSTHTPEV